MPGMSDAKNRGNGGGGRWDEGGWSQTSYQCSCNVIHSGRVRGKHAE